MHYNKVRAAFAPPGLHSQTNDNDLPFVLMMQQQENNEQSSQRYNELEQNSKTTDLDSSGDSENDLAPDDFLLVEVVRYFIIFVNSIICIYLIETIFWSK